MDSFPELPERESSRADTVISAQWNMFQNSNLQTCNIINLRCFKSPGLQSFVTAAVENKYAVQRLGDPRLQRTWKEQTVRSAAHHVRFIDHLPNISSSLLLCARLRVHPLRDQGPEKTQTSNKKEKK